MPSLHAAYPAMVYLFAVKHFGWKGNLFLPYALTVWVGIVYTAQHWVIDVTVGIAYAALVFGATVFFARRSQRQGSPPAPTAEPASAAGRQGYDDSRGRSLLVGEPARDTPSAAHSQQGFPPAEGA
jgi:membrane-associated phospholipid phosphatase